MIELLDPSLDTITVKATRGDDAADNSLKMQGINPKVSQQKLEDDIAGAMNYGLQAFIDMQEEAFAEGHQTSALFRELMSRNPSTASELFEERLRSPIGSAVGSSLQPYSELSRTWATIKRWLAVAVACEIRVKAGGESVDVYREYGIDLDEGRHMKSWGIKIQAYARHLASAQLTEGKSDCVYVHTDLISKFRPFRWVQHLKLALDRIKNLDHLYALLENPLLRFEEEEKIFSELTSKQADRLTRRLSDDPDFWGELIGLESDDASGDGDQGDGGQGHEDNDGQGSEDPSNQGKRGKRKSLEEFFRAASKVNKSGSVHLQNFQEFHICLKNFDLPDNEIDAMRVDDALHEFIKGFGALTHLYHPIQRCCDKLSMAMRERWKDFKKNA